MGTERNLKFGSNVGLRLHIFPENFWVNHKNVNFWTYLTSTWVSYLFGVNESSEIWDGLRLLFLGQEVFKLLVNEDHAREPTKVDFILSFLSLP